MGLVLVLLVAAGACEDSAPPAHDLGQGRDRGPGRDAVVGSDGRARDRGPRVDARQRDRGSPSDGRRLDRGPRVDARRLDRGSPADAVPAADLPRPADAGASDLPWPADAAVPVTARVTVSAAVAGKTPLWVGYNQGHFMPGTNTATWVEYAGVNAMRIWASPAYYLPKKDDLPPWGDGVSSLASFNARRAALRKAPESTTFINWPLLENRIDTQMRVKLHGSSADLHRVSYVQFKLGPRPPTLRRALLRLWRRNAGATGPLTFHVHALPGVTLAEKSVTWQSAPGLDPAGPWIGGPGTTAHLVGQLTAPSGAATHLTLDLTRYLQRRWTLTLALIREPRFPGDTADAARHALLNSREAAQNRPTLQLWR